MTRSGDEGCEPQEKRHPTFGDLWQEAAERQLENGATEKKKGWQGCGAHRGSPDYPPARGGKITTVSSGFNGVSSNPVMSRIASIDEDDGEAVHLTFLHYPFL